MQDNRNQNRRHNNKENIKDVLPSSQILEKFEDAVPHSVEKLINMAKKEQEHRHEWQSKYLASYNLTYRAGQFFGLVYNIALLYVVYDLISSGEKDLGVKIFTINALVMIFAILATTIERKVFSRRPSNRFRNNNRNDKRLPKKEGNRNKNPRERESQVRR